MQWNRHIISRLAAVVAFAAVALSCAKTEIVTSYSSLPMKFSTYTASGSGVTKADGSFVAPDQTSLPDSSSFGVFAFLQEGVVYSYTGIWADLDTKAWKPEFMFNEEVTFDGTDYSYSPIRYWPYNEENTISFWAYYPYGAWSADNSSALKFYAADGTTAYSNACTDGLPIVEYTVDTDPDNQVDLLFDSFTMKDKTYGNCAPTRGVVDLNFRHALALVEFRIVEGTGADVDNFTVSDLYWKGTCANPASATLSWNVDTSSADDFSVSNVSLSTTTTVAELIVIPQTLASTAEVAITYDILFASSDPDHPDPIVYSNNSGSALLTTAGITEWQAGKHYVYNITAGFERIEFSSAVASDWTTGANDIPVQ